MPPSQPPPSQPPLSHRAAVLVTRPQPAADRLAGRLRAQGLSVQVAPLMRIVPVAHDAAALARAPGLVFTSAHAVAMAGPGLDRPAMCVGPATADAARAAGFRVTVGPGDAAGLLPLLTGLDGCGKVLELASGKRLEPSGAAWTDFKSSAGQRVLVRYEPNSNMSICMVGQSVTVTCIQPADAGSN